MTATSASSEISGSSNLPPSTVERLLTDGVTPLIHEDDFIYKFLVDHPRHATNARGYYFADGRKSAELLKQVIESDTAIALGAKFDLLEFASGYGCVTRHLPLVMPLAQITACDIHEEAISFITEEIGQKAVLSRSDPKEFELDSKFDIVFALSFFSHMPKATWDDWLAALFRHVRPGGSLIFTTHGKHTVEHLYKNSISLPSEGFWFSPSSEQHDLDVAEYGTTIVSPEYVTRRIFQRLGGTLSFFSQGFWWGSQDVWVVTKLDDRDVAKLEKVLAKRGEQVAHAQRSAARETALTAKNSELRRALYALSNELREREQRIANGDPERQKLFDEILDRERKFAAANANLMMREMRDREERLVAAHADLRRMGKDVEDRDRRLVTADADLRRMGKDVEDRDRRLVTADADLRRLTGEIEDRERRLVAADGDLRRLTDDVSDRDRRLVTADADLRRLTGDIEDRERRLIAADGDLRRLADDVKDRDLRLVAADRDLRRLVPAEARLRSIESSTSWRALRQVHRFVPRFLHRSQS